jgi:uncharacterized protein
MSLNSVTGENGLCPCSPLSTSMSTRFILFLNNLSSTPIDALHLRNRAKIIASQQGIIVRDARVASSHIEYDLTLPSDRRTPDLVNLFNEIGTYAGSYQVLEKKREKEEAISEAVTVFNEEKFWIAHEILESIWKQSKGKEKDLLGGIILVCAGLVHYQKNEEDVCISIFGRAFKKLSGAKGLYHQVDVDRLKQIIRDILIRKEVELFKI